ncbi:MAG: malate dehydrogenase [Balneola sp.]|jgi:malate dehydrogenase|uniref:malate dehydrogenase n=1 Tax=Balneola sp. EhC07 TaxID=1849360 RepID=UPI0007F470B0|nr:malate dehydrogenase [Balneola sp. EhC07]MAB65451.1 malate dehydrogenase [Bacteroidota bacterium]MAC05601.1 malate dehydrogenase [Balneola sp.]MBR9918468.1 malate dehydrogenase [bacterium]MAO76702.1 malate dehydrogenase [Balneola sp.]MBF65109.1 malate dehydrogenase [Balneola sp.]|tara:strand:- start:6159 stop:7115 length:957 start_codon:yes stop_codon:yes gene_type:complete
MKVTVVGAGGNVGSTVALSVAQRDFAKEVIAVDLERKEDDKTFYPSKGRALDQWEASPIHLFDTRVKGTTDYADTANSDVCVITAGVPRRPGMSRDDLLEINANIVRSVTEQLVKHSPDTIIIVVSNPLDVMVQVAKDASGLPYEKVMGMAGILDTARYRAFIAEELDVSPKDIQALLMGGHGDTMVPLPRFTTLAGMPITHFISDERLEEIVNRAKKGGGEIVGLMGTSAWYAPGAAAAQMVEAILLDQNRIFPVCAHIDGQYGVDDLYIGVPVKLGKGGIKEVIEVELTKEETDLMHQSADAVRGTLNDFKKLMNK